MPNQVPLFDTRKKIQLIAVAPSLVALLLSGGISSVSAANDAPIDEIQVTATRREKQASEVSAAVTVITASDIRDNKLVTDALESQSGVFLQQTTPGQGAAIVRGLKGSEVLHLVDGMRLNNAIFRNAPTPFLALVPVSAAERVEVLRGVPASLYGSDAVGGVVQVVSRFPAFDGEVADLRGDIFMSVDSAEETRILRGTVEYGTNRIAGLASAEYLQAGDRRIGGGERIAPTGYESGALRLAMVINPDDQRQWLFDLQWLEQPDTPRIDELVPGYGQTEPSSAEYFFRPNARYFAHTRYRQNDGFASADWTFDAGWQRIVDDPVTRDFGSPLRSIESNSSDLVGITVNAAIDTDAISWIAGGEWYLDRTASQRVEQDINTGNTAEIQARYPDGSDMQQAALYVNAEWRVAGRHTLSGGIRYSKVGVNLASSTISPAANVRLDDISFDAGWIVDIGKGWQLAFNAGRGFRAPNVFDLGTLGPRPGNRFNVPNPELQSEQVWQFDAGLRYRISDGRFEIVAYRLAYTDRIASVLTGDVTPDGRDIIQSRNVASADIHGVEAVAAIAWGSAWSADFLMNYTWGEQAEPDGSLVPADRVPPLNAHLNFGFHPLEEWRFEASLRFAGRQDRLSPRDVRDVRINPDGTAGWGTFNVSAEWASRNGWKVGLGLENILDHDYRLHGSGIDQPGRNVRLDIARNW